MVHRPGFSRELFVRINQVKVAPGLTQLRGCLYLEPDSSVEIGDRGSEEIDFRFVEEMYHFFGLLNDSVLFSSERLSRPE